MGSAETVPSPRPAARILLVDDDTSVHEVIATFLRNETWRLDQALSAKEAFVRLGQEKYDLLLLDLGLPDADGFEVLKEIKREGRWPALPVIALTAWNSTEDKIRGFASGAVDYIVKPFEQEELRARVRSALRSKFLQDELERTNADLRRAREIAEAGSRAKSDYLAKMSHEIRTPMNGVIATLSLLEESPLGPEQRDLVETVKQSGEALLGIIDDILDFAKIESGRVELEAKPFDLRACVQDSVGLFAAKARERGLLLGWDIGPSVPDMVVGDGGRLRQVITNLLSNAIKFTPDGEIMLEVKRGEVKASDLGLASDTDSRAGLRFSVHDTGVGIAPEKIERLFSPFTQAEASTSREYGGTGLGLAISSNLVQLMGGRMWAESFPGRGSTFHFTLEFPLDTGAPDPAAAKRQAPLKGARALVAGGRTIDRRMLVDEVRRWGMLPAEAGSAGEVIAALKSGQTYAVVLITEDMASANEREIVQEIRAVPGLASLPLILCAAVGQSSSQSAPAGGGFNATVMMPPRTSQLLEVVSRMITGATAAGGKVGAFRLDGALAARLPLRILLVDDNPVNLKVGIRLLQRMGYQPELAAGGREAVQANERTLYDLVFMDVQMPELDGLAATVEIRTLRQRTQGEPGSARRPFIIAMTANAMQGDRERCLESGMDDYLAKPVRSELLQAVVERWGSLAVEEAKAQSQTAPVAQPAVPTKPSSDEDDSGLATVDWERLDEFACGDADALREIVALYLDQAAHQLEEIEGAIRGRNSAELRRTAHHCVGSSATCGMERISAPLRELERLGSEQDFDGAEALFAQVLREHERIKAVVAARLGPGALGANHG